MDKVKFNAQHRVQIGKNQVKQLGAGIIPAVVYGASTEPLAISLNLNDLTKLYNRSENGKNTILELEVTGETSGSFDVIAYQIDYHPVKRKIIHIDFLVVSEKELIKTEVPCRLTGTAKGQKMAGILIHNLKTLKIQSLPAEIPAAYTVDITEIGIGESIRVRDLEEEGSISLLNDPYDIILQVDAPRVDKATAAAQAAAEEATAGEATEEVSAE